MNSGSRIVFIVGCPRSGTTWLQRLLAAHPQVYSGPETNLFIAYFGNPLRSFERNAANPRPTGLGCYFTREEYRELLNEHLQAVLSRLTAGVPRGSWWLEKTPGHALWIPEICAMLPDARVIHLLRDGRDVVASLMAARAGWGAYWAPQSVKLAAKTWVQHVRAARKGENLLHPGHWMEARYETLISDPLPLLERCAEFLDLEWSRSDMECAVRDNAAPREGEKQTAKPSESDLVQEPVTQDKSPGTPLMVGGEAARQLGKGEQPLREPEGFIRRAKVGSWKEDLPAYSKWQVNRYAGALLRECGYS